MNPPLRVLYAPGTHKDRRLVVRVGVGIPTKDYRSFFEIASRCPDHRFVLAVCPGYTMEHHVDRIVATNAELGNPAEIRHSLHHEQAAAQVRATLPWSDGDWEAARQRSVARAYGNFVSTEVLAPIVSRWREIARLDEGPEA